MNQYQLHPFCEIFPEATAEEKALLKASINERGQIEPIVLLGDQILDGRSRYQACQELKAPPQFRPYNPIKDGTDPLKWVIDKNIHRRHLTVGQRATLAHDLQTLTNQQAAKQANDLKPNVEPTSNDPEPTSTPPIVMTQAQAAAALGVSTRSVGEASSLAQNDPEGFTEVKAGKVTLNAAQKAAKAKAEAEAAKEAGSFNLDDAGVIPNQYRHECADLMAASHGDKFAEAVRNDTILRDSQLREFMKLAIQDQMQVAAMVAKGWKVKEAVKFAKGIFAKDDTIRELLNLAIMRDGKAVTKIDSHTILIIADELLHQASYAADIAAIHLAQAKPETTAPPVDNSFAKAMEEAATPGKLGKGSAITTGSTGATAAPNAGSTKDAHTTGEKPAKKLTKAEQKAAEIERQGKRELFLVSVEKAPKKNRVKMVLDYWRDNGDEAATYLMEYPTLTHKPDPLIVATLDEIAASIRVKEIAAS